MREQLEREQKRKSINRMMGSDYMPMMMMKSTMKRKELPLDVDEVSDDLHDFSLSSPARKIRRLNAQLPPIMEEERDAENLGVESSAVAESEDSELPPASVTVTDPVSEEKAIVLYQPHLQSSSLSLSVSVDLISGFKNQFFRGNQAGRMKLAEDEEDLHNKNNLAVVPWVPSQFQLPMLEMDTSQSEATESMEADVMEEATMEIDHNNNSSMEQGNAYEFDRMMESDGLNQWQQQHCMIRQLPQSTSTPITWSP